MKSKAFIALIYTAIILTLMEYLFIPPRFEGWLAGRGLGQWLTPTLAGGWGWVISCWVGFVILPVMILKYQNHSLKDFGFHSENFLQHLKIYLGLFALMSPFIYFASEQPSFQLVYPFVPEAKSSLQNFILWELGYISQFFCLEFFFRGFLLYSVEKESNHWLAIAVMVVPYTMIHFHKPMLETFGAVIAGVALGHLSLKYRSWLGGAILHSLVAITMDLLATHKSGLF